MNKAQRMILLTSAKDRIWDQSNQVMQLEGGGLLNKTVQQLRAEATAITEAASVLERMDGTNLTQEQLRKLEDKYERVGDVHTFGNIDLVRLIDKQTGTGYYKVFVDGKSSTGTAVELDQALLIGLGEKYKAGEGFAFYAWRMLGLTNDCNENR
jgi:hypothetical protein